MISLDPPRDYSPLQLGYPFTGKGTPLDLHKKTHFRKIAASLLFSKTDSYHKTITGKGHSFIFFSAHLKITWKSSGRSWTPTMGKVFCSCCYSSICLLVLKLCSGGENNQHFPEQGLFLRLPLYFQTLAGAILQGKSFSPRNRPWRGCMS